jgi:hypothetical protein
MLSRFYVLRLEIVNYDFLELKKFPFIRYAKYSKKYAFIQLNKAKTLTFVQKKIPKYFEIAKCCNEDAFTLFDDVEWDSFGVHKLAGRQVDELIEIYESSIDESDTDFEY